MKKKRGKPDINEAIANLSKCFLRSSISFAKFSSMTLKWARKLTNSPVGFVGYINESGFLAVPTLSEIAWKKCRVKNRKFVFKKFSGLWGWVLKNKKSIICNNPRADERSGGTPPGHIKIDRFIAAPAMSGGKIIGMIAAANSPEKYSAANMDVVKMLANFYAIALDRRKKERKIRDSEEKYRLLLNASPDIIYTIDGDGIVRHASESVRRYGYKPSDIVGKPAENFCHKNDVKKTAHGTELWVTVQGRNWAIQGVQAWMILSFM